MASTNGKYRVLIIDDEELIRTSLGMILEFHGYEVILAEDGSVGIDAYKTGKFDIVLLDLRMPGVDGYQVLKSINFQEQGSRVICFTGYGDDASKEACMSLGATDYFFKPVNIDLLVKYIQNLLS